MATGSKSPKTTHRYVQGLVRCPRALVGGRSDEFDERVVLVRDLMQSLLKEAMQSGDHIKIDPSEGIDYFAKVDEFEALLITTALSITGGRQKDAAKLLNLIPSTLCTKMKKFKIRVGMSPGHGR